MSKQESTFIAIVGGGLAGLTLSIGLSRHGIPHHIYESASTFSEIGAGIALGPNSIAALELIDPRIKECLSKCVTYNESLDSQGEGKGRDEWLDIRVGEERESVFFYKISSKHFNNNGLHDTIDYCSCLDRFRNN